VLQVLLVLQVELVLQVLQVRRAHLEQEFLVLLVLQDLALLLVVIADRFLQKVVITTTKHNG
jgi:hypothetical protein